MSTAPMPTKEELRSASLPEIAALIAHEWERVPLHARAYLDAMFYINSVQDNYGMDSGKGVVLYFLSNASTWRGPVARLVKAELKRRVK